MTATPELRYFNSVQQRFHRLSIWQKFFMDTVWLWELQFWEQRWGW